MAIVVSVSLTSCGAKPAIIQMTESDVAPEVGNELDRFAEPTPTVGAALDLPITPTKIFVHVCGAVNRPGVYEMLEGNRIFEAIELAAGFTEEAQAQAVNLADKVTDGMQVFVPTKEEAALRPPVGNALGHSAEQGVLDGQSLININTADVVALQTLNGIGEAKAKGILSYRENNGLFNSIEDIKNVSGIGEKLYERIKENITVD